MEYKLIKNTKETVSVIGQGNGFGNYLAKFSKYSDQHIRALQYGIDLGMTFIDTAEEYGMGMGEEIVAKATKGIRNNIFISTKVSSDNLKYNDIIKSAEASLKRLKTDYIDLYQVHWPNPKIPLDETLGAMDCLINSGKVRYFGVCNFTLNQIKKIEKILTTKKFISTQMEYNLIDRTIESSILPYCQEKGLLLIAYSPLVQGQITGKNEQKKFLADLALKYNMSIAQLTLVWLISRKNVITIPHSINKDHIRQNAESLMFKIDEEDIETIDNFFEPQYKNILPEDIRVYEKIKGSSTVYKTIEEARLNRFNMVPSPTELAKDIAQGEVLKPIKVKNSTDSSGRYKYDLIEGRLRYWAWVIAFNGEKPVPVLVCD